MPKLTKRFVESVVPDREKTLTFWDSDLKGFGVVILPSGRQTYCIQYRNAERILKRFKIGVHGQISTEAARTLAKKQLGSVSHGEDPQTLLQKAKGSATMTDLVHDYLTRHGPHKRSRGLKEDKSTLERVILPLFGDQKVTNVTRRDIETLHLSLSKTPYQANRTLALLSKMFNCAITWGWRGDNPVKGVQKYPEEKRDRWLDEDELARLWDVLDQSPTHLTAIAFKLLLLTGARKNELLHATWDQFDLGKGIWTKPSHMTKQKKKEYLPLSEETLALLKELRSFGHDSPYLFPGKVPGKPIQETKTFWRSALKKAGLENVRIHDLRHTHASHLVSSGLSLSIVGKLLGHTQASTTQRYAHLSHQSLKQATSVFGAKMTALKKKNGTAE